MEKLLQQAIDFANQIHAFQFRKGLGTPYLIHPLEVLQRLAKWGILVTPTDINGQQIVNLETWIVAILHDVEEESKDPNQTFNEIQKLFGEKIAGYVHKLSFFPSLDTRSKDQYLKDITVDDVLIFVVKLADRFCNVDDFMITSPPYAPKYYYKAKALYDALSLRKDDIKFIYGDKVYENILTDWSVYENIFC